MERRPTLGSLGVPDAADLFAWGPRVPPATGLPWLHEASTIPYVLSSGRPCRVASSAADIDIVIR